MFSSRTSRSIEMSKASSSPAKKMLSKASTAEQKVCGGGVRRERTITSTRTSTSKEKEHAYLLSDGDVAVGKRVSAEHARLDVLVLGHLDVLLEGDSGRQAERDVLEFGPHLEVVQVGAVAVVEESRDDSVADHGDW